MQLPLVRLKIENTNFPVIKSKRINDTFMNRVANPTDFLQFYKKAGFMANLNANKTLIGKMLKPTASSLLDMAHDTTAGISGLDIDENHHFIDKLIKKQIRESCSLNLVTAGKMAQVIDKYV
jgi:Mre11 DNA-binding presumed domain